MDNFFTALSSFATRWRLGLLLIALLSILSSGWLLLIAGGLLDYAAPFSDAVRPVLFAGWCSVLVLMVLRGLAPLIKFGNKSAATFADATLQARRPVTTALEISRQQAEATPLRRFLTEKALWQGTRALRSLPFPATLPWHAIRRSVWRLTGVAVLFAGLCIANLDAVKTIAGRLLRPHADIPPYSALKFEVTPVAPKVVYGSDAELEVSITGGTVPEGVVMLTRENENTPVMESGAFAMGGGRFGQKLQRVTQPVQIAFSAGAARSVWITVEVMRQPRVESVILKITPPAYAKRPSREFSLGTSDLVALAGSEIEARITSNRPLSGGVVVLTPPRSLSRERPETITTRASGEKEVTLKWKAKWAGLVRLDLKDITGAGSATPVELEQKLLPDNPPVVALESPAGVTLATPESEVPLKLSVEDDLGLARIDLVRKLSGFRDRGRMLTGDAEDADYALEENMKMSTLGVVPGQTLEFYAEAHDHNPSLMGIASSPLGRIQIISTENYADLMRARTTLEQFRARFSALNEAVEKVRDALAKAGDDAGREAAQKAMQQAEELAAALVKDFQAFDAEKKVAEEAQKISQLMQDMQKRLASGSKEEVAKMQTELGEAAKNTKRIQEEGQQLTEIGRVLEMAAEFKAMHAEQKQLVAQLEPLAREIMHGDMRNAAKLDGMARQQQAVLEHWKAWLPELRAAAEALPSSEAELKKEALEFADEAEKAGIQRSMETAMEQAKKDSTPNTFVNSQLALVGMDTLMNSPNKLCQSCKDGKPRFMSPPNLAETLAQMLAGMCKRRGQGMKPGKGQGTGLGEGGDGDGYATEGDMLLNAPVYGPDRLAFNGESSLRGNSNSRDKGKGGKPVIQPEAANAIHTETARSTAKRQISLRDVPERYREAVRRFYGEDVIIETSTSKEAKP
ncbi:hypothetical protein BH11VER1_BH11VER1_02130 [soil metagenome]